MFESSRTDFEWIKRVQRPLMTIKNEVRLIVVGLAVGSVSILVASAARDLLDAFLQQIVPVNEKYLSGWSTVGWKLCYALLLIAVLVVLTVVLV